MSRDADPIPDLKCRLGAELARLVAGWNGDDIAFVLRTDRSRVAELRREKLDRFSLETLIRFLERLDRRVELIIAKPAESRPRGRVG